MASIRCEKIIRCGWLVSKLSPNTTMETPIDGGKGAGEGERESVGEVEGEEEKFCYNA